MREKIARAICQADEQNGGPPWEYVEQLGKHAIITYFDRADAVLDALMEPTEGMVQAPYEVDLDFGPGGSENDATPSNVWRAMIQAARDGK